MSFQSGAVETVWARIRRWMDCMAKARPVGGLGGRFTNVPVFEVAQANHVNAEVIPFLPRFFFRRVHWIAVMRVAELFGAKLVLDPVAEPLVKGHASPSKASRAMASAASSV